MFAWALVTEFEKESCWCFLSLKAPKCTPSYGPIPLGPLCPLGFFTCAVGLTLRETIYNDKLASRTKEREVVFGKTYWSRLRALFTSAGDIDDILKLTEDQKPPQVLFDAFKSLIRHPPNRSYMMSWAARTSTLNVAEMKLVLLAIRRIAPTVSDEQRELGLELLRLLQRAEAKKHFPNLFSLLRTRYDDIICEVRTCRWQNRSNLSVVDESLLHNRKKNQTSLWGKCARRDFIVPEAWSKLAGTRTTPTEFLEMCQDVAWTVLPEELCRRVVDLPKQAPLTPHKDDVKRIVTSSECGERLFSCACKQIVAEEVDVAIKKACKDMLAQKSIDTNGMVKAIQQANDAVNRISCIELLPPRRLCSLEYRGLSFQVHVKSIELLPPRRLCSLEYRGLSFQVHVKSLGEQIDLSLRAALRAEAVRSHQLEPLPAEDELGTDAGDVKITISESLLRQPRGVRRQLQALLREESQEDMNGDVVMVHTWSSL